MEDPGDGAEIYAPSAEEMSGAPIYVWWDIDNCEIGDASLIQVIGKIKTALSNANYSGQAKFHIYGHRENIRKDNWEDGEIIQMLEEKEIIFEEVTSKDSNAIDRRLVDAMVKVANEEDDIDDPQAKNYMRISRNPSPHAADMRNVVKKKKRNNLMVAGLEEVTGGVLKSATHTWIWRDLRDGKGPKLHTTTEHFALLSSK